MTKLKKYLRWLMYLSVLFLVWYLTKVDYLVLDWSEIRWGYFTVSVLFLFLGFTFSALSWRKSLNLSGINVSKRTAIYSHGVSVFAKYIPGKIWVILGRASIVSEKGYSLVKCSASSLNEQLVFLLSGFFTSLVFIAFISVPFYIVAAVILTAGGILFLLLSKKVNQLATFLVLRLFKKNIDIPMISARAFRGLLFYTLFYWLIWSLAFFLLVKAFYSDASIMSGLIFPISGCYGLLAFFLPGGIGVREGIITYFLTQIGVPLPTATAISVGQRLWFITGEVYMFLLALLAREKE